MKETALFLGCMKNQEWEVALENRGGTNQWKSTTASICYNHLL